MADAPTVPRPRQLEAMGCRPRPGDAGGGPGHCGQQGPHAGRHAGEGAPMANWPGCRKSGCPLKNCWPARPGAAVRPGRGPGSRCAALTACTVRRARRPPCPAARASSAALTWAALSRARAPAPGAQAAGAGRDGGRVAGESGDVCQAARCPGSAAGLSREEVRLDGRATLVPARIFRRGGGYLGRVTGLGAALFLLSACVTPAGTQIYRGGGTWARRKGLALKPGPAELQCPTLESPARPLPSCATRGKPLTPLHLSFSSAKWECDNTSDFREGLHQLVMYFKSS